MLDQKQDSNTILYFYLAYSESEDPNEELYNDYGEGGKEIAYSTFFLLELLKPIFIAKFIIISRLITEIEYCEESEEEEVDEQRNYFKNITNLQQNYGSHQEYG